MAEATYIRLPSRGGYPTQAMEDIVKTIVEGKHVYDLGAGSGALSIWLSECGASRVTAVDEYEIEPNLVGMKGNVAVELRSFEEFIAQLDPDFTIDVAFLSWPVNRKDMHRWHLINRSKTVIYLGSNTDANACGGPEMWDQLHLRELLHYERNRRNSMLVYSDEFTATRKRVGEEYAAWSNWAGHKMYRFEEIEAIAAAVGD